MPGGSSCEVRRKQGGLHGHSGLWWDMKGASESGKLEGVERAG